MVWYCTCRDRLSGDQHGVEDGGIQGGERGLILPSVSMALEHVSCQLLLYIPCRPNSMHVYTEVLIY